MKIQIMGHDNRHYLYLRFHFVSGAGNTPSWINILRKGCQYTDIPFLELLPIMFALLPPVPHLVKAYPVIQPFHFADTYLLAVIELVGKIVFFLTRHRCFFVSIYKGAGNDVPDVSDIHPFNLLPGDM